MVQVSPNTIAFDQIFFRVKEFVQKDIKNSFISNTEKVEEYNKLLNEIQDTIARPSVKYNPFIKGEPPNSSKINTFSIRLSEDFNSIAKQLDYINAKTINVFNLFTKEVENEKRYSERIASKVKILQMYSRSSSNDVIYYGDSFDNYDQIDIAKIKKRLNPLIINGTMTLPIESKRTWGISKTSILPSNGFSGNSHQVIKTNTAEGNIYEFVSNKSQGINRLSSITDSNPLTYFEYEAINVEKNTLFTTVVGQVTISENEFCYISDKKVNTNVPEGQTINWSNHNTSNPLRLILSFDARSAEAMSNCIDITPYFASCNYVKVVELYITDSSGVKEQILKEPIYIGSTMIPVNLQISKNYFYNMATIRYPERKTQNIQIIFEQPDYKDIEIQHLYWKPNYQEGTTSNSPFVGLKRFNPDSLNRDIYEEVQYDIRQLLPPISNPTRFKKMGLYTIPAYKVEVKKKPITYEKWAISFKINNAEAYFYDFSEDVDDSLVDYVVTEQLPNNAAYSYSYNLLKVNSKIISGENAALVIGGNTVAIGDTIKVTNQNDVKSNGFYKVKKVGSASEAWQLDRIVYVDWTYDLVFGQTDKNPKYFDLEENGTQYLDAIKAYIGSLTNGSMTIRGSGVTVNISDPKIGFYSRTTTPSLESISVPLISQYELYNAKRMAIGIRDISISHEKYASQAEIVSKPFSYDIPIEALMLSVDSNIDNSFLDKINFNYYVSLNGGSWFRISPLELDNRGIAEVFAINQNVPEDFKLPGVAYLNYPEVPLSINNVSVKIEMLKDKNINITPEVYAYQLIAKVKR